jgi:hypothetical protein
MIPPIGSKPTAAQAGAPDLIARGTQGPAVVTLQKALNDAGSHLDMDGKFGPKTEQAVRDFQKQHGLDSDGIVGPKTLRVLASPKPEAPPARPSGGLNLARELASPDSRLSVAIGVAEGTRTTDGARTAAYNGHQDPKRGYNVGTFSYQHAAPSPAAADQLQLQEFRRLQPAYEEACRKAGLDPSDPLLAGSCFDLYNQAPLAVTGPGGFLDQLPSLARRGVTPANVADARYRSYYDPQKGKFDTTFTLPELKADQRRRTDAIASVLGSAQPQRAGRVRKTAGESKPSRNLHVNVDFVSQFHSPVPGDYAGQPDAAKCDNACQYMMEHNSNVAARVSPGYYPSLVHPYTGEGAGDRQIRYVEQQLRSGKPVMIGVHHDKGSRNTGNDFGINHFLVATGMGTDARGRRYITFNDPAHYGPEGGKDTNPQNRLYLEDGRFRQSGVDDPYELRGVVENQRR